MENKQANDYAALYYGINMLRLLRSMQLLTENEYSKILQVEAQHYDPQKKICLK